MSDRSSSIFLSTVNSFGTHATDEDDISPGRYNPRLDLVVLNNTVPTQYPSSVILAHEVAGHRGCAVQGDWLRIQRHLSGILYSYIDLLVDWSARTGLPILGNNINTLQLSHSALMPKINPIAEFIEAQLKQLHNEITLITAASTVVSELLATDWTIVGFFKYFPEKKARQLTDEYLRVAAADKALKPHIAPDDFLQMYKAFRNVVPQSLRIPVGSAALSVDDWAEDGRPKPSNLTGKLISFIDVCARKQEESPNTALDSLDELFHDLRLHSASHISYWTVRQPYNLYAAYRIPYKNQFPWLLIALLDRLVFDINIVIEEGSHDIFNNLDKYMEWQRSFITITMNPESDEVIVNEKIRQAAFSDISREFLVSIGAEGVDASNPLGLDQDWYKWLLLYETLYLGLVDGQKVGCALADSISAGCSHECPIRRYLQNLARRSELTNGVVCPLKE